MPIESSLAGHACPSTKHCSYRSAKGTLKDHGDRGFLLIAICPGLSRIRDMEFLHDASSGWSLKIGRRQPESKHPTGSNNAEAYATANWKRGESCSSPSEHEEHSSRGCARCSLSRTGPHYGLEVSECCTRNSRTLQANTGGPIPIGQRGRRRTASLPGPRRSQRCSTSLLACRATGRKQRSLRKGLCGERGGAGAVCQAAARKLVNADHIVWRTGHAMCECKAPDEYRSIIPRRCGDGAWHTASTSSIDTRALPSVGATTGMRPRRAYPQLPPPPAHGYCVLWALARKKDEPLCLVSGSRFHAVVAKNIYGCCVPVPPAFVAPVFTAASVAANDLLCPGIPRWQRRSSSIATSRHNGNSSGTSQEPQNPLLVRTTDYSEVRCSYTGGAPGMLPAVGQDAG